MNWRDKYEPPIPVGEIVITTDQTGKRNPNRYIISKAKREDKWYVWIVSLGGGDEQGPHKANMFVKWVEPEADTQAGMNLIFGGN